jgi:hypothetical protein
VLLETEVVSPIERSVEQEIRFTKVIGDRIKFPGVLLIAAFDFGNLAASFLTTYQPVGIVIPWIMGTRDSNPRWGFGRSCWMQPFH